MERDTSQTTILDLADIASDQRAQLTVMEEENARFRTVNAAQAARIEYLQGELRRAQASEIFYRKTADSAAAIRTDAEKERDALRAFRDEVRASTGMSPLRQHTDQEILARVSEQAAATVLRGEPSQTETLYRAAWAKVPQDLLTRPGVRTLADAVPLLSQEGYERAVSEIWEWLMGNPGERVTDMVRLKAAIDKASDDWAKEKVAEDRIGRTVLPPESDYERRHTAMRCAVERSLDWTTGVNNRATWMRDLLQAALEADKRQAGDVDPRQGTPGGTDLEPAPAPTINRVPDMPRPKKSAGAQGAG